ncbi:unnamed protein product [Calypogeia fissa]
MEGFFKFPAVASMIALALESCLESRGDSRWGESMKPMEGPQKSGNIRLLPVSPEKVTRAMEDAQPQSRMKPSELECRATEPSLRIQLLRRRYETKRMNHVWLTVR